MLPFKIIPEYPRADEMIKDGALFTFGIGCITLLSKKVSCVSLDGLTTLNSCALWVATATVGAALGREFFIQCSKLYEEGSEVKSNNQVNCHYCVGNSIAFPRLLAYSLCCIGGVATAFFLTRSSRWKQSFPKYELLSLVSTRTNVLIGSIALGLRHLGVGKGVIMMIGIMELLLCLLLVSLLKLLSVLNRYLKKMNSSGSKGGEKTNDKNQSTNKGERTALPILLFLICVLSIKVGTYKIP